MDNTNPATLEFIEKDMPLEYSAMMIADDSKEFQKAMLQVQNDILAESKRINDRTFSHYDTVDNSIDEIIQWKKENDKTKRIIALVQGLSALIYSILVLYFWNNDQVDGILSITVGTTFLSLVIGTIQNYSKKNNK